MSRRRLFGFQRGFSLFEALCSVALLFMAIGAFMELVPFALQSNQHESFYLQAVAAGQEYLDELRGATENNRPAPPAPVVPIDAGYSLVDATTKNPSPGDFQITGACLQADPVTALQYCSVTVQWSEYGQTRTYTVESYATQQVS